MRTLTCGAAVALALLLAAPSAVATAPSGHDGAGFVRLLTQTLERASAGALTGTVTYDETNGGKNQGQRTLGIVGHGVFTTKASSPALLGAIKGVPLGALLDGGTYVVHYDIDAKNAYHGLVLATFKHGLGSLCLEANVSHGALKPGTSFLAAKGSLAALGGTGKVAVLHGSMQFTQTNVAGSTVEKLSEHGTPQAVRTGSATALPKACRALAKPAAH